MCYVCAYMSKFVSSYVYTCHCYSKENRKDEMLSCSRHLSPIFLTTFKPCSRNFLFYFIYFPYFMLMQIKPNLYSEERKVEAEVLSGRH